MKAIILVAGYATRLYPLTKNMPKALLKIGGKPIIDYIVDELNTIDAVDDIIVVSNHKFAAQFEDWSRTVKSGKPVSVLDDGTVSEDDRRGAIGDILFAVNEKSIDDETVIIAGDNFFTYKLKDYYDFYREKGCDCVCVKPLNDMELAKQFGIAALAEDGRVQEIQEKPQEPKSDMAVYATYLYTRETMKLFQKYIDEGNNKDAPGHFPEWLCSRKEVYAYVFSGECYDIGTPKSYEEVCDMYKNGK